MTIGFCDRGRGRVRRERAGHNAMPGHRYRSATVGKYRNVILKKPLKTLNFHLKMALNGYKICLNQSLLPF